MPEQLVTLLDSLYYLIGAVVGWVLAVLLFCLLKYLYGAD